MRLLIYHNILWPKHIGAVFSQVYALSRDSGVDVQFVHLAETEDMRVGLSTVDRSYHDYPYRVLFTGTYERVGTLRMTWALLRDFLTSRGDVVVLAGYERPEYWALLLLCLLLRQPRLVFVDGTIYDRPRKGWRESAKRWFFQRCDGILCYGSLSREYLRSYDVAAARIFPGCQATALAHDYDAASVLSSYQATQPQRAAEPQSPEPRFLYLGRLAVEKGLFDLLEAFKSIHTRQPGARLDLVGAGPLRTALVARISELALDTAVSLQGTRDVSEFASLFAASTAMVLPSYSEPWGLVVNEALSYGCPVVVSDRCGCVPELVVSGVTGFTFAAGNVEALSQAMLAAARLSENRLQTVRQCLKVMSDFTPQRAAQRLLDGCNTVASLVTRRQH